MALLLKDIRHVGLKDVYWKGSTTPPPPATDWRRCLRLMNAMCLASSAAHPTLVKTYGLRSVAGGGHEFPPSPSGGIMSLDWSGSNAVKVDWR
jgi:hypothetical protein